MLALAYVAVPNKQQAQLIAALKAGNVNNSSQWHSQLPCTLLLGSWDEDPTIRKNAQFLISLDAKSSPLRRGFEISSDLRSFKRQWERQGRGERGFMNLMLPGLGIGAVTFRTSIEPTREGHECTLIVQCMPYLHDRLTRTFRSVDAAKNWALDCQCAYGCVLEFLRIGGAQHEVALAGAQIMLHAQGTEPAPEGMGLKMLVSIVEKAD